MLSLVRRVTLFSASHNLGFSPLLVSVVYFWLLSFFLPRGREVYFFSTPVVTFSGTAGFNEFEASLTNQFPDATCETSNRFFV